MVICLAREMVSLPAGASLVSVVPADWFLRYGGQLLYNPALAKN